MKKQTTQNNKFLHLTTPQLIKKKKEEEVIILSQPQFEDQTQKTQEIIIIGSDPTYEAEEEDLDDSEIEQLQQLARFNEYLVDLLDKSPEVNHFFNMVPLAFEGEADTPSEELSHTYTNSIGSYLTLLLKAEGQGVMKDVLDQGFDVEAAQKYALLQLWIKAEDAHEGNIIIGLTDDDTMIPISIDFGRCLSFDLESPIMLPRTTRWEQWPALEHNLEKTIKTFIMEKDPAKMVKKLKDEFFNRYSSELNEEQQALFEIKFNHLYANMIMVQEAVKEDLNFKQILSLILPVIDTEAFNFVTQGMLEGGDLFSARKRYATLKTAFREAWKLANGTTSFDPKRFRKRIRDEIGVIKHLPMETLNERYYHKICYELRKGLYL